MRPDTGWGTVQMPAFVMTTQAPTFVHPELKAREANALRDQVEAFINGGGAYERIEQPAPRPRNTQQA
ncbi:hypothetical protein ACFOLC_00220 [Lysobacter cavernae]|uniref:Uncharacterized protein n=1 Tax=Lysobacter cavernae TaxID=1685901 RepID=A0ABV7RIL2_9GAMM